MPATLKLFKKAPETASQADATVRPKTKPAVVETAAFHDRQTLQDNSTETAPDFNFVRSNN